MESNKEEALRAIGIAQRHRDSGNFASARRFAEKSLRLFDTPEAQKLLNAINSEESASTSSAGPSSSASGAEPRASSSSGTRQRHAPSASSTKAKQEEEKPREFTPANEKVVKRVRTCKVTDYYGILGVQRDGDENDVKKAYRKVGLFVFYIRVVLTVFLACSSTTP
jgi:DnaJ family protein B protein 12